MLINIQPLIDIVSLTLQSRFLKKEKNGVSLLLIGKPETAKTSTIFEFSNLSFVGYYDEITQKKLIDEFLPLVQTKQKRTLLIPDLINCIEKQKSTRQQFLNILKSGIDDTGVTRISTYHKQLFQPDKKADGIKFNLITAITSDNFRKVQRYFTETGLLSRFITFSYDYPISTLKEIIKTIEGTQSGSKVTIPKIKKKNTEISNSPHLFAQFEFISSKLGLQYKGYGIRSQINLQRLAKANALLNNRTKINQDDINKIIKLSNWFNFNFNPI